MQFHVELETIKPQILMQERMLCRGTKLIKLWPPAALNRVLNFAMYLYTLLIKWSVSYVNRSRGIGFENLSFSTC